MEKPKNNPENELINQFPITPEMNCLFLINGGTVIIEDCLLSLSFIINNCNNILPAVIVNQGAELIINKVEIKGNKSHETIGVIVKKGDATIKECKIHDHL